MLRSWRKICAGTVLAGAVIATGCALNEPPRQAPTRLQQAARPAAGDPQPAVIPGISPATFLPRPGAVREAAETYTVVVHRVPADELLFALARDAGFDIDIAGDIHGRVTLNAVEQTLAQILDRIALQVPLRYTVREGLLAIAADEPYLHSYAVDYLNIERLSTSRVALATQIGTVGSAHTGTPGGAGHNNSEARIENVSRNAFWNTLVTGVAAIIGVDDLERTGDSVLGTTQIIVNREAGLLSVRATARLHAEIERYVDRVTASARRQVLIEATIVEVTLSDDFQAGIDWRLLGADPNSVDVTQSLLGANLTVAPFFSFTYAAATGAGDVTATVKSLQQFGNVRVLSSPKIIALNNQTAILKVVDNVVYFTTDVETTTSEQTQRQTFETTVHTVPVGFVMNVTPFISEIEEVILNVRPTISRVLRTVNDPNPQLARSDPPVASPIPEIQVREMESMLRVGSGQTAVIGGLMQDKVDEQTASVPFLSGLPLIGPAFTFRRDRVLKTELIVFLRPRVIHVADVDADLRGFRPYLSAPGGVP